MKTFVLTTALALAVSLPAVAQTQLERSVGAAPGQYTLNELVRLKLAESESGNEAWVYIPSSPVDVSSQNSHSATAQRIFEQLASEDHGDNQ